MAFESSQDRFYTNPGDIFGVFRALQSDRSTVNVQFRGLETQFNSLILGARLRQRIVLLDEITPSAGHDRAINGEAFSLRASVNGIRVFAPELRVVKSLNDEDGLYYEVAFPEKLQYLQRRDAFRVMVPKRVEAKATCHFEDRKPIQAGIENLSATGIRLQLSGDMTPELQAMEKFRLQLDLPRPDGSLSLQAQVMHNGYDSTRDLTLCGCRFLDLSRAEHIQLNRFVTRLQREARL